MWRKALCDYKTERRVLEIDQNEAEKGRLTQASKVHACHFRVSQQILQEMCRSVDDSVNECQLSGCKNQKKKFEKSWNFKLKFQAEIKTFCVTVNSHTKMSKQNTLSLSRNWILYKMLIFTDRKPFILPANFVFRAFAQNAGVQISVQIRMTLYQNKMISNE